MAMRLIPIISTLGVVAAGKSTLLAQKNRPIQKVVKMLQDMNAELQAESKDDEEVYEKITCWCKTNRDEKTAAITLGEKRIEQLEAQYAEAAAKMKELKAKEKKLRTDNRANQKALDDATALRMKENKAFHENEKDSLQTIAACKDAIVVLSKHHPELAQLKSVARVLSKHIQGEDKSTIEGMMALKGFLTNVEQSSSFLQIPGFQSHASQSGQVFGMLKQMKETFEGNLSAAQKEEQDAVATFQELKAAKEAELKAGREQLANVKADHAKFKEDHAQFEDDMASTTEQLENDREFLANLEEKCAATDDDYARRTKSRNDEIEAVNDTIKILNSDDTFDAATKSVNTEQDGRNFVDVAFVQESMMNSSKKAQVVALLSKSKNPKIMLIATYAKLDAFVKVKKAIDDMIATLKDEQADEVKHKDWCNEEFNQNQADKEKTEDEKANQEAKIAELDSNIKRLTTELDTLKAEIKELNNQSERAGDDRARENADFRKLVEDQRVTQGILNRALARMQQKYNMFFQQPGGPHTQTSGTKTDPGNGPAAFSSKGSVDVSNRGQGGLESESANVNAGGNKVVTLLSTIIADSKKAENDAIVSEKDAQIAYESFIKESNKSVVTKSKAVTSKTGYKAQAVEDKAAEENNHAGSVETLANLAQEHADLKGSCDFVLQNFEVRQEARTEEMEALAQAKNILSGSK